MCATEFDERVVALPPPFELPLRVFSLSELRDARTVGTLLSRLGFPASARLDISSDCMDRSSEDRGTGIVRFLHSVLPSIIISLHRHVDRIDLIHTWHPGKLAPWVELIGYCPSSSHGATRTSCPPWKLTFLGESEAESQYTHIISTLGSALSTAGANVQTLNIRDFDLDTKTGNWWHAFSDSRFASLRTLSITGKEHWNDDGTSEHGPGFVILAVLTPISSNKVALPNLRLLDLQKVDTEPPSARILAAAARCLGARQARDDIPDLDIHLDGVPVEYE